MAKLIKVLQCWKTCWVFLMHIFLPWALPRLLLFCSGISNINHICISNVISGERTDLITDFTAEGFMVIPWQFFFFSSLARFWWFYASNLVRLWRTWITKIVNSCQARNVTTQAFIKNKLHVPSQHDHIWFLSSSILKSQTNVIPCLRLIFLYISVIISLKSVVGENSDGRIIPNCL